MHKRLRTDSDKEDDGWKHEGIQNRSFAGPAGYRVWWSESGRLFSAQIMQQKYKDKTKPKADAICLLNPGQCQMTLSGEAAKRRQKQGESPDDTSRSCSGRVIAPPELQAELAGSRAAKI